METIFIMYSEHVPSPTLKKRVWKKENHIKAEQQSAQAMWKDWRFMQYFMVVEYVDTEMRNKTNNPYCKFSLEVFKATWSKKTGLGMSKFVMKMRTLTWPLKERYPTMPHSDTK